MRFLQQLQQETTASFAGADYMPIKSEYLFGGYEVDETAYAPNAADMVVMEAIALLKTVR